MKNGFSDDGKYYIEYRGGHNVQHPASLFGGKPKHKPVEQMNYAQLDAMIRRIVAEEIEKRLDNLPQ